MKRTQQANGATGKDAKTDWQAGYRLCCWDRPWAKDEACGENEIDANGFLNPLGTLNLRGQPHLCQPPSQVTGLQHTTKFLPFSRVPSGRSGRLVA